MMRPGKFHADLQKHIITSSLKPDPENNNAFIWRSNGGHSYYIIIPKCLKSNQHDLFEEKHTLNSEIYCKDRNLMYCMCCIQRRGPVIDSLRKIAEKRCNHEMFHLCVLKCVKRYKMLINITHGRVITYSLWTIIFELRSPKNCSLA